MPLYACQRCGFTSAAFRPEAVSAHRLEHPECDGVMRIVFRSEDRYRGSEAASLPAAQSLQEDQTLPAEPGRVFLPAEPARVFLPTEPGRVFDIREGLDTDGTLRLTLLGDLDLAVAGRLSARLAELKAAGRPVRLDLSQLAFIDSSGIQAVLVALTDARWIGWQLEVAREVSPSVERAAQVVGIAQVLWPADPGARTPGAAPSAPPPA